MEYSIPGYRIKIKNKGLCKDESTLEDIDRCAPG
jgi:hypothetical protein